MDGKNNKLQYRAVPVYFNSDARPRELPKKDKLSTLIRKMNQNQLLYSSDSECEYQIITKVHKKPRKKRLVTGLHLGCVICNMRKDTATELQAHIETVHDIVVDLIVPSEILEYGTKDYVDGTRNQLCAECGMLFQQAPLEAINHVQTHLDQNHIVVEEIGIDEQHVMDDAEYVYVEQEDIKPVLVEPKTEYVEQEEEEYHEEPLIEENVRTTFKCKICNVDFMCKDDIKTHIQQMHNQPRMSVAHEAPMDEGTSDEEPETYEPICYICESVFASLAKMRKHIRVVHKTDEAYFCNHCTGTFTSLDMYEDHECLEEVLQ